MKADKPKVVDEVWDDARVRAFLDKEPMGPRENAGFSKLLYAYRSMRPEDFSRFLTLYVAAGHDVNATDRHGRTLSEVISTHRQGREFREALARVAT